MPIIPPSPDKFPQKSRPLRHLDELFLTQRLLLRLAHESLRQLAQDAALPTHLRTSCASLTLRLGKMERSLARWGRTRQP